ncbi:HK97 family phage prohead protease [Kitasatospora sp. NPDC096147]|uniref:HK97 family phage prohead protease n=1 Tax=Kitasatospora sp. NPDC096147 TaxID=3364093 RepID=UPI00382B44CE
MGAARTASPALDHKQATLGLLELEADEGRGTFTTLVSVTGLLDHDGDVIEPGAYARTLTELTPKGVWSHDWNVWTARTEHIEELLPGDARLPKTLPGGQPWPPGAGALLVKGLCNLGTQAGQDMYANLQFFKDQVQWSIGYKVRTAKRSKGARRITDLDLYEYSPVLFGANPHTSTLDLKSKARGLLREAEVELAPLAGTLEDRIDAITTAVQERLLPPADGEFGSGTLQIIGTYPDRVIASLWRYTADGYSTTSWEVPYTLDGTGVPTVGEPRAVRLVLDVEDGTAGASAALAPLVPDLERVASHLKTLTAATKEGRALSGENATRLATAVQQLVAVLGAAGIDWQQPEPQSKTADTTLDLAEIGAALALFADAPPGH